MRAGEGSASPTAMMGSRLRSSVSPTRRPSPSATAKSASATATASAVRQRRTFFWRADLSSDSSAAGDVTLRGAIVGRPASASATRRILSPLPRSSTSHAHAAPLALAPLQCHEASQPAATRASLHTITLEARRAPVISAANALDCGADDCEGALDGLVVGTVVIGVVAVWAAGPLRGSAAAGCRGASHMLQLLSSARKPSCMNVHAPHCHSSGGPLDVSVRGRLLAAS